MPISLPLEIYPLIFLSLVDDSNLGDNLDERVSPFRTISPAYPPGRSHLAMSCARVSKVFYDFAMPIVWEHVVVQRQCDLVLLCRLSTTGAMRRTRRPLTMYTKRLDIAFRRDDGDTKKIVNLLSGMHRLHVLVLNNHFLDSAEWSDSASDSFFSSLPTCLRRLQFLDLTMKPSFEQLRGLSKRCESLQALQVVSLRHTDEESDQWLAFPALKVLSIGANYSSWNAIQIIQRMKSQAEGVPELRYLEISVPFEEAADKIVHFRQWVQTSVFHASSRRLAHLYELYSNLHRLVVVVSIGGAHRTLLPKGLNSLRDLEIVTEAGPGLMYGDAQDAAAYDSDMLYTTDEMLSELLDDPYPLLRRVVLWKRVPGNRFIVEELIRRFKNNFQQIGVELVSEVVRRYLPILDPRTFLDRLAGLPFSP